MGHSDEGWRGVSCGVVNGVQIACIQCSYNHIGRSIRTLAARVAIAVSLREEKGSESRMNTIAENVGLTCPAGG